MSEQEFTPDSGDEEFSLVLPFIDQSAEFALGFEAGQQYARMQYTLESEFTQTVHTENAGQLLAAARSVGWQASFEPLDECWSQMHAARLTGGKEP